MKIHLDCSIMSDTEAFGYVHGSIDLSFPPRSGDCLSLAASSKDAILPDVKHFTGRLKVEKVTFTPMRADGIEVSLTLDDIIVSSREDARKVASYLEQGFSLYFDEFEQT